MGVDYDAIGGVGIIFDEKFINSGIEHGLFTREEWDEEIDKSFCLEKACLPYARFGNTYINDYRWALLIDAENLSELNQKAPTFINEIKEKFGIELTFDDLIVLSELHIY